MSKENKWFRFFYCLVYLPVSLLYRVKPVGRENIPEGSAVFCANHSSWADPFLIAFALTRKKYIHIISKIELFKNRFVGWILSAIGMIPVHRDIADVTAIKTALKCLRNSESICIFPEGTRISEDFSVAAKNGAIKLAEKTGTPIVPIHIPRRKRLFGSVRVVIGKPYYINKERQRLTQEDYNKLSQELMTEIKALDPENL